MKSPKNQDIQTRIDLSIQWSSHLSPDFGRETRNPLLRGHSVTTAIRYALTYVVKAWDIWQTAIESGHVLNHDKALFRASVVYIADIIEDARWGFTNSKADELVACDLAGVIHEILCIIDGVDINCMGEDNTSDRTECS